MKEKKLFLGELALMIGLIFNSLATTLMVKSEFGISSISSVPYTLSLIFDEITYGSWNYIFQCFLIIMLVLITKNFNIGYIISFFLALIFGNMIDLFNIYVIELLPNGLVINIIYFVVSLSILSVGISLLLKSTMPVLPIDTFIRDFAEFFSMPYKNTKTGFDLLCLGVAVLLSGTVLNSFEGIGIGTILCALITGKLVSYVNDFMDRKFYFQSIFTKIKGKRNEIDIVNENIN